MDSGIVEMGVDLQAEGGTGVDPPPYQVSL